MVGQTDDLSHSNPATGPLGFLPLSTAVAAATAAILLLLGAAPLPAAAFQGRIRWAGGGGLLRPTTGATAARSTAGGGARLGGGRRRTASRLWATRPPQPPGRQQEEEEEDKDSAVASRGEDGSDTQPPERRTQRRSLGALGLSRNDALSALGVAAVTGFAITTARPDLTTASLAARAGGRGAGAGAGEAMATSSVVASSKKGYLGWRRLSDVEARAKDQNKSQVTYPVRFVAYLSRFLLNFDEDDRALWARLAREIPFTYTEPRVEATRRAQFAALADSVEIGLYDFQVCLALHRGGAG